MAAKTVSIDDKLYILLVQEAEKKHIAVQILMKDIVESWIKEVIVRDN